MTMHRVAFNALFLHFPHSGTGRYVRHLTSTLNRWVDPTFVGAAAFPPLAGIPPVAPLRIGATPFDRVSRQLAKVWFEQVAFPVEASRLRSDVAHYPFFAAPLRSRVPTVVTVHDLVPVLRPEYRRTAAQRLYTTLVIAGLRTARLIITDSQASARDLQERLAVPPERVQVVPLGVDQSFAPLTTPEERAWAATVVRDRGLVVPYILYLGGFDRRKNVECLVQAFATLKRATDCPHVLALIGQVRPNDSFFYDPTPDLERLGITDSVKLLGTVEDREVRALHAKSDAFVFPSLYEGFGLPPLEAMACGAPVICSDASSLPEVVGDAGLLFDAGNPDSLAAVLQQVVSDEPLRKNLSERAVARASEFTWDRTVQMTVAAYDQAVGVSGRRVRKA